MTEYSDWKQRAIKMIAQLPESGAVIIVPRHDVGKAIRAGVCHLRGESASYLGHNKRKADRTAQRPVA